MDENSQVVGKCIKTDNILLVKIEKNVIIIDDHEFKLLKLGKKIPLFKMEGSLSGKCHQIGLAFLELRMFDIIGFGQNRIDVVFIVNFKAFTAPFWAINAVFFEGSDWDILYSESMTSLYGHLTFEKSDWEDFYKNFKMYMNVDIRNIPVSDEGSEYFDPDYDNQYYLDIQNIHEPNEDHYPDFDFLYDEYYDPDFVD